MIVSVCVVLNMIAYFMYPNPPFEPSTASNPVGMIRKPLMDRAFLKAIIFLAVLSLRSRADCAAFLLCHAEADEHFLRDRFLYYGCTYLSHDG